MSAKLRTCCHSVLIAAALSASPAALADILFVRVDGLNGSTNPAGQGSGWGSNAYLYLQDGLDRAAALLVIDPTDEIEVRVRGAVGSGIPYFPDDGVNADENERDESFRMRPRVRLYGQFIGGTGGSADTRDPTYLTVLSGEINTAGFSDNSYHVVSADNTNITVANCMLDGFTITKGNGDGLDDLAGGGGVWISNGADVRVHRCLITDNRSGIAEFEDPEGAGDTTYGAGVQVNASAPVFTLCTFSSNRTIPARSSTAAEHQSRTMPTPTSSTAGSAAINLATAGE